MAGEGVVHMVREYGSQHKTQCHGSGVRWCTYVQCVAAAVRAIRVIRAAIRAISGLIGGALLIALAALITAGRMNAGHGKSSACIFYGPRQIVI